MTVYTFCMAPYARQVAVKTFPEMVKKFSVALTTFRVVVKTFSGGIKKFSAVVKKFLEGLETFSGGLETFLRGRKTFQVALKKFLGGRKTFLEGVKKFLGAVKTLKMLSSTCFLMDETFHGALAKRRATYSRETSVPPTFWGWIEMLAGSIVLMRSICPFLRVMLAFRVPNGSVVWLMVKK